MPERPQHLLLASGYWGGGGGVERGNSDVMQGQGLMMKGRIERDERPEYPNPRECFQKKPANDDVCGRAVGRQEDGTAPARGRTRPTRREDPGLMLGTARSSREVSTW